MSALFCNEIRGMLCSSEVNGQDGGRTSPLEDAISSDGLMCSIKPEITPVCMSSLCYCIEALHITKTNIIAFASGCSALLKVLLNCVNCSVASEPHVKWCFCQAREWAVPFCSWGVAQLQIMFLRRFSCSGWAKTRLFLSFFIFPPPILQTDYYLPSIF